MAGSLRILRPDDLVVLDVELVGLRAETTDAGPVLDHDPADGAQPLLVFTLQPQHVAEQAYFDASPDGCGPPSGYASSEKPDPPGRTGSRLAGPSRVVFSVPPDLLPLPLSVDALLGWDRFTMVVPPASRAGPVAPPPIAQPGPHETAIEFPWRLVLSPEEGSGWETADSARRRAGRTELWRAVLGHQRDGKVDPASSASPVPVRAVWSPDWRPPDRSWQGLDPLWPFRTLPTQSDRHQLVTLMAGFAGYEVYVPTGASASAVPTVATLEHGETESVRLGVPAVLRPWIGESLEARHRRYRPKPAQASRVFLSALGASVRVTGQWDESAVPRSPDPFDLVRAALEGAVRLVEPDLVAGPIPDTVEQRDLRLARALDGRGGEVSAVLATAPDLAALLPKERSEQTSLSYWRHDAVFGRDQYVVVAIEGALFPTGHRAVHVRVMERRIERTEAAGAPVANLYLHELVIRRQRVRNIPLSAAQGRRFPFGRGYEVLTERTPHLTDTTTTRVSGTEAFWIKVSTGATSSVALEFDCAAIDAAGRRFGCHTPMIFVPLQMWEDGTDLQKVAGAYTAAAPVLTVGGDAVTMASPAASGRTETQVAVATLTLAAVAAAGGPDRWVPAVAEADVTVPDIAKVSGPARARRRIAFDDDYVTSGPAGAGVWAKILPEAGGTLAGLGLTAGAAGGVALPEYAPSALSRELGPTVKAAVAGTFDPTSFFPAGATLFGVVPLSLLVGSGEVTTQAPKLVSRVEGAELVTELSWKPKVPDGDLNLSPLVTVGRSTSTLELHAEIRRAPGAPASKTRVTGSVTNLTITIAQAVIVEVAEFSFASTGSDATTVDVKLRQVGFTGPLQFLVAVQRKLAEFSSLLGVPGGPRISVDGSGVRWDEVIALPPFGLAVFSLHDVRLTTGVVLPLVDGRPALRFGAAERHHPFVLTISLLGGGGYLELEVDTAGIRALDAAIEFGGEFQLDIGVASGGVRIMAGIFFTYDRNTPSSVIGGFFEASGYVSVLGIVTVSVVFRLELGYDPPLHKVHGSATINVSVSIAGISKSVSMTVERSFAADGGDPDFAMLVTPAAWDEYAEAFA